ncbi:superoxide dismutase family protein [Massilia sp. G4R7]|uniref:Superoxide dismutase [Cu-Zn] n=1 Tax=Massilia phyllostachyos TaxID=2898585 RepID=A0ABS8Q738_9BURK|nr:superoxide dismutase family protein [Massilia phyllostachyos]MCD2516877.1 superoxide dismutase family protein [Massilia phyllostachyos]
MNVRWMCALVLGASCAVANAADTKVTLKMANEKGAGEDVGTVTISETGHGLVFTPMLKGLPPGLHGFHVHENGSCGPNQKDGKPVPAGAAGGHMDPAKTGKHGLPWGDGHLGDLPALTVDDKGMASNPVLAPRLKKLADVKGKALMVHAGGDNHSDHPAPLGGGGGRIACGVIQ